MLRRNKKGIHLGSQLLCIWQVPDLIWDFNCIVYESRCLIATDFSLTTHVYAVLLTQWNTRGSKNCWMLRCPLSDKNGPLALSENMHFHLKS